MAHALPIVARTSRIVGRLLGVAIANKRKRKNQKTLRQFEQHKPLCSCVRLFCSACVHFCSCVCSSCSSPPVIIFVLVALGVHLQQLAFRASATTARQQWRPLGSTPSCSTSPTATASRHGNAPLRTTRHPRCSPGSR
ncbi:hypothetical protein PVAP13_2NG304200 [Panicum virgatum]|uniref:Uncharacterized protein n=1 Tax=Panicum virgatum TaxID=38727 RepID=A0A8T0VT62_PANVG|nr:hypothetical protein PVAP13_2NG304200 [Panicum virgatum]